jgi:predicted RNA-binding protein with RPS1 domain
MKKSLPPLSTKERSVLEFIENELVSKGLSPSYQEICDHFGFASFNSVQNYLKQLSAKGYVELPQNQKRAIHILHSAKDFTKNLEERLNIDSEKSDQIMTITQVQKNGVLLDGNSNFALNHLIRNATPEEHKANKRLTGATYFLGWDLAAGNDQHIKHLVKSISKDERIHLSNAIKAQQEVS